jgi:signal transduction histidine kinase
MDLHDGIIQSLYGIGLAMDNARDDLKNGKGDAIAMITQTLEAIQSAIADIRAYILDLRPRQLQHANLFEGMRSLAREFRANTLVNVDLDGRTEDSDGLARPQVEALFHIYQEALSNTAKHAQATNVSVRLWRNRDRMMLRISDDGQGFELPATIDPKKRIGHGLGNMRARAESAGGGMEVVSIRKQGTILTAWVPFIQESEM